MKTDRTGISAKAIFYNNPQFAIQLIMLMVIILAIIVFNIAVIYNLIFVNH
jgi:hypothetical protein